MDKNAINYNNPNFHPNTLVELLQWRAATQPDTRAYTYLKDGEKKEVTLTYGELDKRARAIAVSLQKKGLAGERALLLYPPGLEYISGFFGCLYAGVIAVPAYPPDPNRLNRSLPRLQSIVNDSKSTIALTTDSIYYMIKMLQLGSKFTSSLDKVPVLRKFRSSMKYFASSKGAVVKSRELGDLDWVSTDSIVSGLAEEWRNPNINAETTAFLQYTSGSTGTPKGVILSHENLLHNSEIIKNGIDFSTRAEIVVWLPIYHDMGLIGGVLQPLYSELPTTLMSPLAFLQRPLRWLEVISRIKGREVGSPAPNFAYELCIKKATPEKVKQLDLSNWVYALSGAEPVRHQTIEKFTEIFKPAGFKKSAFYPAFGLAEATLLVTGTDFHTPPVFMTIDKNALKRNKILEVAPEDTNSQTLVSCGQNQPTQETSIVNPEKFTECKHGEIGEIWIKGQSVSKGYYNRPKETKETFENYLADTGNGPFLRTGDLGFFKNNELFITGRVKDLIIIRGTNHYPQDIELTVEQCHTEIRHGCSAAFTIDVDEQEQLVTVLEVRHSKNIDFDEIIQSVRQAVTENHDLQVYAAVLIKARSISKTSSGKIQRRATKVEFLEDKLSVISKWEAAKDTLPILPESESSQLGEVTETIEDLATAALTKDKLAIGIEKWLIDQLSVILSVDSKTIDIRQPFISFGLDSAQAVGLAGDLEEWLDRELPPTLIWDYPTIEALAKHLASEEIDALPALKTKRKPTSEYESIAIVGMGARFPGANNYQEFWDMLKQGLDGISEVPPDRWDAESFYDADPAKPGKMITKYGGFIDNVDLFDANFFGISPREAAQIDPQQRILLELSWDAFENAGQTIDRLAGSRTGVYIGISTSDYVRLQKGGVETINPYSGTGNALSIAANRLSYVFDLRGPSLAIDTACSSSLVAVHKACQSLRNSDCDMALAGGVNLILSPELTITFSQARMMSPDGKCKTFDANADGYGRGEGAGVVVLKRLSDALENKDRILAVIKGSAINQDGRSNGITAPNGLSQQAVINEALDNAGLAPDQIKYIETHGTGTILGDPIEVESIKKTMLQERSVDNPLLIGSVKTNIGHLEAAAGIAGLIKVILALRNEEIPPHTNFKSLSPHIKIDNLPLEICTNNFTWKQEEKPRYAGISAFGFGGTNAHVILEEAPLQIFDDEPIEETQVQLLSLSAHNEKALRELAVQYAHFIENSLEENPQEIYNFIYSSNLKRSNHDTRLAVTGKKKKEFSERLRSFSDSLAAENLAYDKVDPNFNPKIAFVYSGQGPQWWAMGRELMENEIIFRATIERISFLLQDYTNWSLIEELNADEKITRLNETEFAQPALFAIQVGLTALWRSWGIIPNSVIGHSVGEVAAVHVAGILNLEDAVKVIYHRSRLMQKATGLGKMAAVDLPHQELKELISDLEDQISLGALNSVTSNVISGKEEAIDQVIMRLKDRDVFNKKLPVNYAFHSPQMEPFQDEFKSSLEGLELHDIKIPIISTVTGKSAESGDYGPEYWARNIREAVQFSDGVNQLLEESHNIFIEIGPHPVLKNYIQQNVQALNKEARLLASLRRKRPERAQMLNSLGNLFVLGYPIDWKKLYSKQAKFLDLPFYPFQRERYWIDEDEHKTQIIQESTDSEMHPLLGEEQSHALFPNNSSWTVMLKSDYVAYLNSNRNKKTPILPESAYLEMAIAASKQTFSGESTLLKNIIFKNVLKLSRNEVRQLHFTLTPLSGSKANFQAYSKSRNREGDIKWIIHSLGSIIKETENENHIDEFSSLAELKSNLVEHQSMHKYFESLSTISANLETLYNTAEEIWTGKQETLLKINLKKASVNDLNTYHIHPIILDTCFKIIIATAFNENDLPAILTPHSLDYLKLHGNPSQEMWVHVKINNDSRLDQSVTCQLHLMDNEGNIIIDLHGLRLKPHLIYQAFTDFIYEVEWQEANFNQVRRRSSELIKDWIILADDQGVGEHVCQQLKQRGKSCLIAKLGDRNAAVAHDEILFNPDDKIEYLSLFNRMLPDTYNLLCFWNLNTKEFSDSLLSSLELLLNGLDNKPAKLWCVTENEISDLSDGTKDSLNQSFLLDKIYNLISKQESINFYHLDIDSHNSNIFNALHFPPGESQIGIRGQKYFVPRLIHSPQIEENEPQPAWDDISQNVENSKVLNPGMIEIEVKAASLSMRDLQIIDRSERNPIEELGLECSGIVRAVHESVKDFKIGDKVVALAKGSLGKFIQVSDRLTQHKPDHLQFEEAATIPLSFLTSQYALVHLGRIREDESILILDAASEYGLAAIQIAKLFNARIFVTGNSTEKKNFLKSQDIEYIYDGNNLEYVDKILNATQNNGVDIVLNCSDEDQGSGSFSLLKEFGRYLDLNTYNSFDRPLIYQHLRKNISYFSIDMEHVISEQSSLIQALFSELMESFSNKKFHALQQQVFSRNDIQDAFNKLKENRKIGKYVVTFSEQVTSQSRIINLFEPHETLIIAGTIDQNDLGMIDWLINHGAKNIYVVGLENNIPENEIKIRNKDDINIQTLTLDNLNEIKSATGILISIGSISSKDHDIDIKNKIEVIYEYAKNQKNKFLITTSIFDLLPSQDVTTENVLLYNTINALNRTINKIGLPAIQLRIAGAVPESSKQAMARWNILEYFLDKKSGDFHITDTNWDAIDEDYFSDFVPAVYSELISMTSQEERDKSSEKFSYSVSREDLLSEDQENRPRLLEAYLREELSKVVKIPASKIDSKQSLIALGIDSLMAIELKNTIESKLGVNLPIATLLQGPSIETLTDQFLPQLTESDSKPQPQITKPEKPTEIQEFKLSHGQRAMYFQHVMAPESIFNLAYAVRIRSDFDKDNLRNAFQKLVERHPSLRTTFILKDGQPIQRIHPEMDISFHEENIASWDDDKLRARLDEEVLKYFDLENGPLLRVLLFKKSENNNILLFVMHHIVTDIWSQALLLNELSLIFNDPNNQSALLPLAEDYTDYIRWQNELLDSDQGKRLLNYWKDKLSGELPILNIPTDFPRPSVQTYKGKTETLWFGDELSEKIKGFCEKQGVTIFTALLSAYYILLSRYTGQKDIIVGSPTAGRSKQEFANIIGYFVNPIPFRAKTDGKQKFSDFLDQVKETVLEAFDNMDYPLTMMVEKIHPVRDPGRTPLFQTMFILQRAHLMHDQGLSKFALSREGATMDLGGLTIESMNLEQGVAPFDLTMMTVESGTGLAASLGYNVDLFEKSTIQRMLNHYVTLLNIIISNPAVKISDIDFLSNDERKQILDLWNQTSIDLAVDRCIHQIFENQVKKQPHKKAVVFENQELTYDELNRRANQLAHFLRNNGVSMEDMVGICLERSIEMVIAMLGVLKAGAAYVPIDPSYPQERIRYMFTDSDLSIILTQKHLLNKLEGNKAQIHYLDNGRDTIWAQDESNLECSATAENLVYIIYTSGSTGRPKGTMLQHRGLINALKSTTKNYYVNSESQILQFASFSFDASVEEIFSALISGATIHMVKKDTLLSLGALIEFIKGHNITNMTLPPSVLSVLQPEDFPSLRSVISAGEKCTPAIANRWSKDRHFINGYGPTETTICTTTYEIVDELKTPNLPIGKPVANARIYVLDENMNPVPQGVPGELFIGGYGLARGYFNRPDLTAERFVPNPFSSIDGERIYKTGDLVRYLKDGNIEFIDRIDEQVKVRGYRIELGEIESVIKIYNGIKDAAVIAKTSGSSDKQLFAYVVPENNDNYDSNHLVNHLRSHLPDFMIPVSFITLDKLPLTSNGKLDRKALPDPEMKSSVQTFVKPGNEIERLLCGIWQEVLSIEKVGVNDSFFDLGGHSLSVVQVQGKIKEIFDKEISVVDMFKYPTIRSLAKFFDDQTSTKESIKKSQDRASRQREATRIQQRHVRNRRK